MTGRCGCGRALITRPGDLEETCAQCRNKPDACDCVPLVSDTSHEEVSENTGHLTSENDSSNGSDTVEYELRDGTWLDQQEFASLTYTVPGLMPAGLGIVAAPPKAGKSLLILDWLLAVAAGGQALGALPVGPARDVLYLALEDGDRRLQARCRHLLAPREEIPARFRYILTVPPGQVLAVLHDALGRHPHTALIVLDTLGRIMPLPLAGETTYQRDYRVAVALKHIADAHHGLTIVVIHHTRKAVSDDFIDTISGTHGLAGAADTILTLARGRGKSDGIIRVTGRDVLESDYAVTFHNGVWALDGDTPREARANVARRAENAALSGRSAEILDFIRHYPDGATAKQITDKFGKDAGTYLRRLLASERLTKPERGLYMVSEPSEPSESQVSDPAETDTGLWEVSETDEAAQ
jgi:AAA domain